MKERKQPVCVAYADWLFFGLKYAKINLDKGIGTPTSFFTVPRSATVPSFGSGLFYFQGCLPMAYYE